MSSKAEDLLTVEQVVQATLGQSVGGEFKNALKGVSTDTRTIGPGELFVALEGERFDGHDFFSQAIERGAGALMGRRGSLSPPPHAWSASTAMIEVDDTLYALGEVARRWREGYSMPLLAITGSNGKTTTKEMVSAILSTGRTILKTERNLNNRIGVPLTLMHLRNYHQAVVVEMGTNEPGEIKRLCEIARPQFGMITQVAHVHAEGLGSIEAIAREKGELFEALGVEDTALVNLDDPWVVRLSQKCRSRRITFGQGDQAIVRLKQMDPYRAQGACGVLDLMGEDVFVQMRCYGTPCLENALAAAAAALAMGASPSEIARGLETFQPFPRRMNVISLGQEVHLIDDTYNANPVSMEAALKVLQHLATGRRLAVLGDMRELGEGTRGMHRSIGKKAADLGVDVLIAVGEWAEEMLQGARESSSPPKETYASATAHEAVDMVAETYSRGDWILVKGSRAMALEQVVEGLSRALGLYKPLEQRNAG